MGDGRVDGVFGDVAPDAEIVVVPGFFGQGPALFFHLVSGLPRADQHFADAPHGLAVGRNDRKRAHVVQDVFGGDGFAPDAGFRKGHVLGDGFVEVVTDHQHVQMLFERVDCVGACRVGGGGQNMLFAADFDDVGGMSAARALGVKGVDGAPFHRRDGVLDKARFIQRVGVDHDLHIHCIGHAQATIDGGGGGPPVLVQFQRAGPRIYHFLKGGRLACVAFACKSEVHREGICGLHHPSKVPWAGGAGGGQCAVCRTGAAAQHCGEARMQRVFDLLGANKVDVAVKPACGQDFPLSCDDFGAGAHDDIDARLRVGVAGLADLVDASAAQPDVGFVDACVVHDQRVGDDRVHGPLGAGGLGLPHAVTDNFAAAEFNLFAVDCRVVACAVGQRRACALGGEIAFDFDDQVGVRKTQFVACGGTEHGGVIGAGNLCGHQNSPELSKSMRG